MGVSDVCCRFRVAASIFRPDGPAVSSVGWDFRPIICIWPDGPATVYSRGWDLGRSRNISR
eukprot:5087489-Alexandrium_andersonii.AAC.1